MDGRVPLVGSVVGDEVASAREIPGPIRDYWKGGLVEKLGSPKGELRDVVVGGRSVRALDFEGGVVFWDPATGLVFDAPDAGEPVIIQALAWGLFGRWDPAFEEGVVGVHAALLHTSEVLFWSYLDDGVSNDVVVKGEWSLLSLGSGRVVKRAETARNQFCSGQCLLGDGTLMAVGGDRANAAHGDPDNARTVRLFDPIARCWKELPDLEAGRWYPTVVTYGARTAIVIAGRDRTSRDERQHAPVPSALFVSQEGLTGPRCDFDPAFGALQGDCGDTYPFAFVLPGGRLFVHLGENTRLPLLPHLDFRNASKAVDLSGPRTYDLQGTAVLLPLRPTDSPPYRARVMLIGGCHPEPTHHDPANCVGLASCLVMDAGALAPSATPAHPGWTAAPALNAPRHMGDAVLLPDGKVLLVNGAVRGRTGAAQPKEARLPAELYDPVANQWTELAPMRTPRLYHATALLLPDGRVMATGTDRTWNAPWSSEPGAGQKQGRPNIELFSPPYLFKGPRPTINSSPETAAYGDTVLVGCDEAASIRSAVLVRSGSCTHSFNSDQRLIEVEIVERLRPAIRTSLERVVSRLRSLVITFRWPNLVVSAALRLRMPPQELVAPAGYYMLFLLSNNGVPSVARFVRLGRTRQEPWLTITRAEGH